MEASMLQGAGGAGGGEEEEEDEEMRRVLEESMRPVQVFGGMGGMGGGEEAGRARGCDLGGGGARPHLPDDAERPVGSSRTLPLRFYGATSRFRAKFLGLSPVGLMRSS